MKTAPRQKLLALHHSHRFRKKQRHMSSLPMASLVHDSSFAHVNTTLLHTNILLAAPNASVQCTQSLLHAVSLILQITDTVTQSMTRIGSAPLYQDAAGDWKRKQYRNKLFLLQLNENASFHYSSRFIDLPFLQFPLWNPF